MRAKPKLALSDAEPICMGCFLRPSQIAEYREAASEMEQTADAYVRRHEGTFNRDNGHFLCTPCYIEAGMPSTPRGWVCP